MKFKCSVCGYDVTEISVCKRHVYRDDFSQNRKGMSLTKNDREYLDSEVLDIVYKCKCGINNERVVKDVPHLEDFVMDSDCICWERLTQEKYGTLIVIKD